MENKFYYGIIIKFFRITVQKNEISCMFSHEKNGSNSL